MKTNELDFENDLNGLVKKRDQFAGQVLSGIMSIQKVMDAQGAAREDGSGQLTYFQDNLAELCYQLADAMMKARKKVK